MSIRPKLSFPVGLLCKQRLFSFIKHAGFQDQKIHLGPHEAAIAVFRRTNDRFAAHVEAGVHYHRATCLLSKGFDDLPVERIGLTPHCLYPRGVIDVRDGGYFRSSDV